MRRERLLATLFLLSTVLIAITYSQPLSANRVKYYRNEVDFRSDHPIAMRELEGEPYIKATYDRQQRIVRRDDYNANHELTGSQVWIYGDDSREPVRKEYFRADSSLTKRIIFGMEPKARAFISYSQTIDNIQSYGDRYTSLIYDSTGRIDRYSFHEADASEYGRIGYEYYDDGERKSETWEDRLNDVIIRRWEIARDTTLDIRRIREYGFSGELVDEMLFSSDSTQAVAWFIDPVDSARLSRPVISYVLHDDLMEGTITYRWIGGVLDTMLTHTFSLKREQRKRGEHYDVVLSQEAPFIDSAWYKLDISGVSKRNLPITRRAVTGLFSDQQAPTLTLSMDTLFHDLSCSFTSDESLTTAALVWIPDTSKYADTSQFIPIEMPLTAHERSRSNGEEFKPQNSAALNIDGWYRVFLRGSDAAGNMSKSNTIRPVHFDLTPPEITLRYPHPNSFTNNNDFGYRTNEALESFAVIFEPIGTHANTKPILSATLTGDWLTSGIHQGDLSTYLNLADGQIYRIKVVATDRVGNRSDTLLVEHVRCDKTPPEMTLIFPHDNAIMNSPAVSYAFSEPLLAAEFRWVQYDGRVDTASPHQVSLVGEELDQGQKIRITLMHEPDLLHGSIYSLSMVGQDFAGNAAEPTIIRNIRVDLEPPQFILLSPEYGDTLDQGLILTYAINESLRDGWINLSTLGQPFQPYGIQRGDDSTRIRYLTGDLLTGGTHRDVVLEPRSEDFPLAGSYRLTIGGIDSAGNVSEPAFVNKLFFLPDTVTIENDGEGD